MIRRLVIVVVILAALVAGVLVGADFVAVHFTEAAIAKRIEDRVPGSHARVTITSSPFLYHLAAAGTVDELQARVTGVVDDHYSFQSIDITVKNLEIDRGDLLKGSVHLDKITSATIVATMTSDELVAAGLASGLKDLGVIGSSAHGTVSEGKSEVTVHIDGLTATVPFTSLVPCVGTAVINNGDLVLTCTTDTLPPALAEATT